MFDIVFELPCCIRNVNFKIDIKNRPYYVRQFCFQELANAIRKRKTKTEKKGGGGGGGSQQRKSVRLIMMAKFTLLYDVSKRVY